MVILWAIFAAAQGIISPNLESRRRFLGSIGLDPGRGSGVSSGTLGSARAIRFAAHAGVPIG
jgi:hypothetical protein